MVLTRGPREPLAVRPDGSYVVGPNPGLGILVRIKRKLYGTVGLVGWSDRTRDQPLCVEAEINRPAFRIPEIS